RGSLALGGRDQVHRAELIVGAPPAPVAEARDHLDHVALGHARRHRILLQISPQRPPRVCFARLSERRRRRRHRPPCDASPRTRWGVIGGAALAPPMSKKTRTRRARAPSGGAGPP